jgi:hypothetical protein
VKINTITRNYIDFKLLPNYYQSLYAHLLKKEWLSRVDLSSGCRNLKSFSKTVLDKQYLFAGFNALNASEEKIINILLLIKLKYIGMLIKPF